MPFEPVVFFFILGAAAGLLRSDLKIPSAIYEFLSIYLLLAIGLKGGVELAGHPLGEIALVSLAVVAVAAAIPLIAFSALRILGGLARADAGSIAGHYGSVSVVTFSVAVAFLNQHAIPYEGYLIVFLVLLEMPALIIGVILAKSGDAVRWGRMLREVLFGKSILLLTGGLIIGLLAGPEGIKPLDALFFDLFKGMLALFLREMGLVASTRIAEFRTYGAFLLGFAVVMPMIAALIGSLTGALLGLSVGGVMLLATLYASASYIAAPAAMRIAVPEANPALSIGAALGVTFPFNLFFGLPLYYWLAEFFVHRLGATT